MLLVRLALVWLLLLVSSPALAAELVLEAIDVGQGDALLLTSPTGKRVLVDGGPPEAGPVLAAALRRRGVDRLDLLVITHPHLDHVGGLNDVLRVAPPRLVIDPAIDHPVPAYRKLLRELETLGVPILIARPGRSIDLGGGAVAEVLGPPEQHLARTRSDVNANSVVLRVRFGEVAMLLVGDAEPETEAWLLRRWPDALHAQVLKVAHHGSRHSSTPAFLQAVRPEVAVVSVGRGNDYGHPAGETLRRLGHTGARVLRTDRDGTVRVTTDGRAVRVETLGREKPFEPVMAGAADSPQGRPAPAAAQAVSAPAAAFVGSRNSRVYHRPGCKGAATILPKNLVSFADEASARRDGRHPAGDCFP